MVSLKQIAADLGVSHALVSRVLNNRMGTTGVSAKMREAILRRAHEVQYRPNPLALALREGRRGAIGVFVHGVGVGGTNLVGELLQGTSDELGVLGQNLLLHYFTGQEDFEATCDTQLLSKVDGIIVGGMGFPWIIERLKRLEREGLPVVLACHGEDFGGFANFQVSEELQGYVAAKHLLDIGCRRIVHLRAINVRYSGYLRALADAAVPLDEKLVIQMPPPDYFTAKAGFAAARQLVESGIAYDAIQAQSDAQAAGVLQYFAYHGIPRAHWPKITGVDDSPIAQEYALVPLTSVTAEMNTCGKLAAAALYNKLRGEPIESKQIPPRLVVRESTATA